MLPTSEHPTRIDLGPVSFTAAPGWRFFPLDGRIVARPADGVGVLTIAPMDVVWPGTHEICMSAAAAVSQYEVQGPGSDRAQEHCDACIAGGESFQVGTDFVRIWYRHCPDGTLAAWFSCRASRATERDVEMSIRDCDLMVTTLCVPPPVM